MHPRKPLKYFFTNLDKPMPLGEKLARLVRNLGRRVVLRQSCCGHPGEPGCCEGESKSRAESQRHDTTPVA